MKKVLNRRCTTMDDHAEARIPSSFIVVHLRLDNKPEDT